MTPGRYDLDLYHGDFYTWRYRLWQDAAKTIPIDLSAATVAAQVRDAPAGEILMQLDCVITVPNLIDVRLFHTLWANEFIMRAFWDLEVTFPGDNVQTFVAGDVKVTTDVTNSVVNA
jgi:hypothetical protein